MTAVLILMMGLGTPAQEAQTHRGLLRHHKGLEGGVWTLEVDKTVFDLHGDLRGFSDGDRVEIRGTPEKDKACIHMVGVVFRLQSIRKIDEVRPCR